MPQVGFKCVLDHALVDYNTCINCARQVNPRGRCDFTPEILMGMCNHSFNRSPQDILKRKSLSASMLMSEPRQQIISLFYKYYAPVDKCFYAFRGTMAHAMVESATRSDALHEVSWQRALPRLIDGEQWVVSIRADVVVPFGPGTILDYKSCKAVPRYDKPYGHHPEQLNIYRWAFETLFIPKFEKLRVEYFDMTRPKRIDVEIEDSKLVGEKLQLSAETLVHYIKKGVASEDGNIELPEAEFNPKKFPCSYCDVIDICKSRQ